MNDTPIYETLRLEYLEKNPPVLIANIRIRPKWSPDNVAVRSRRINKKLKKDTDA